MSQNEYLIIAWMQSQVLSTFGHKKTRVVSQHGTWDKLLQKISLTISNTNKTRSGQRMWCNLIFPNISMTSINVRYQTKNKLQECFLDS